MLAVKGLHKSFDNGLFKKSSAVLRDLSFSVRAGRTTGFIGVNGAGKTTSLKCILGFIRPDSGLINFFNEGPLTENGKSKIGYLPERPYFYDFLTAHQFLEMHWNLAGGNKTGTPPFAERFIQVLEQVGLRNVEELHLRKFSKGMLQRIGLAQALLRQPQFLILDEPMSGLDPDGRILIKEIIKQEKARGTTIFFSSHLLVDMDELCDDLVVIDQGQLIFEGRLVDFSKDQNSEKSFRALRQLRIKNLGEIKDEK